MPDSRRGFTVVGFTLDGITVVLRAWACGSFCQVARGADLTAVKEYRPGRGPTEEADSVLARQRQEAILREVDGSGGARVSNLIDALELDPLARRVVSEHVGRLIVAPPPRDEEGTRARTLQSS